MATPTKECPICQEAMKNPRLLPCIHSYCLECLERYCRDNLPGDDVPCPECKTDFQIPKNGLAGLPVQRYTAGFEGKPASAPGEKCVEHDELLRRYCMDCGMKVCCTCCFQRHGNHNCEWCEEVLEKFVRSIDDAVEPFTTHIECFRGVAAHVEAERKKLLDNVNVLEQNIKDRAQQLIQSVELQTTDLLQELQSLKAAAKKDVQWQADAAQLAVTEMESFRTSSLELKSKGLPVDVTQATNEICTRANQLLQTHAIPSEYQTPNYTFIPVNIDGLLGDGQNFIGHLDKAGASGNYQIVQIK